jgi:hypothetical protein
LYENHKLEKKQKHMAYLFIAIFMLLSNLGNDYEGGVPKMNLPMVKVFAGDELVNSGYYVLGPAIGNRVKIGSGAIVYPGRMIKSDSVILPDQGYKL